MPIVILVCADAEWRVTLPHFNSLPVQSSPGGDWLETCLPVAGRQEQVIFLHTGWGKIAAASSTQYAIDRWSPQLLVNLGTCGGFSGEVQRGDIILATRIIVYDIIEAMSDPEGALAHYTTDIDLSWLQPPDPSPVRRALLLSADRDLVCDEIEGLKQRFGGIAGDWESGAIAWVAKRNNLPLLILRGVSDLVDSTGGEGYDNYAFFTQQSGYIMAELLKVLPAWLAKLPRVTNPKSL